MAEPIKPAAIRESEKTGLDKMDKLDGIARMAAEEVAMRVDQRETPGWLNELTGNALPSIDDSEEWHYCWLSTTNSNDPIFRRLRMGYQLVKIEEKPDLEAYRSNGSSYTDCIVVNEMILGKIPMEQFQVMMRELHFNEPQRQEVASQENVMAHATQRDSKGRPLAQVEGFDIEPPGTGRLRFE